MTTFVLVTSEYHPVNGGIAHATRNLGDALRRYLGAEVQVIDCSTTAAMPGNPRSVDMDGVRVHRIRYTGLPEERKLRQSVRSLLCFFQLLMLVRRIRPEYLLSQRLYDLGFFTGLIGRMTGSRTIAYVHGNQDVEIALLVPLRRVMNRLALRLNRTVLTTNRYNMSVLRRFTGRDVHVVPNIVPRFENEHSQSGPAPPPSHAPRRITCIGRFDLDHGIEVKGLSYAIEAMRSLPECVMRIYGEGPLRAKYEALVREYALENRVLIHGKVDHDRMMHILRDTDILLHPALIEGLPMVVLEAMRLGVLVIATDAGGLQDVIIDGETGVVIEKRSSGSIVEKMTHVLANPEEWERIRSAGSRFIAEYTHPRTVAMKLAGILGMPQPTETRGEKRIDVESSDRSTR